MAVIDFHSHILPGIDDGARNLDVSLAMLEKIREQKIDYMAATPHFYASQDRIEKFLDNRERAWECVLECNSAEKYQGSSEIFAGK